MHPVPRESEAYGSNRTISRSKLFFTVPVVIILILSANLLWEMIRLNLSFSTQHSWPFRFTVLSDTATATVLAVFVSLFMGRLQWARSLRPITGIAIDDEGSQFNVKSNAWRVWIYNSGPGGAVIESIEYFVRFVDQPLSDEVVNWVPLAIINDQMLSRGLSDGDDYFIRWNSYGAPFPAVTNYTEGMQLARFTVKALALLRILDIRVRYVDSLGDVHERIVPIMHRLPSVAMAAIKSSPP